MHMPDNLIGAVIDPLTHECKKHGKVMPFHFSYTDAEGIQVASPAFCIPCLIDRLAREYADCIVEPI